MATIKRAYAAAVVLKNTSKYGGVTNPVTGQTSIPTGDIDLETSGYFGSHVLVEFIGDNQTDSFIIEVFGSLDGSIYDSEPYIQKIVGSTGKWQVVSLVVKDLLHFRVGVRSSNTFTEFHYRITHQAWNESNA